MWWLDVPGEQALDGRGVSHCADCDGPAMIGRDCVVIGGGDAAFQEAAILTRVARSVTIIMRSGLPRARSDLVAALDGKVTILAGTRVTAILGDDRVTGVQLDGSPGKLSCEGVFVFVGGTADSSLLPASVAREQHGGVITDDRKSLGIPGLWAIGSVRSGFAGGLREAGEDARSAVDAMAI